MTIGKFSFLANKESGNSIWTFKTLFPFVKTIIAFLLHFMTVLFLMALQEYCAFISIFESNRLNNYFDVKLPV